MLLRIIIAIIVIVLCSYAIARYRKTSSADKKKLRTQYIVVGLAIFLILLTLTGRTNWIGAALGGLLVLAQRLIPLAIKFLPLLNLANKKPFIPTGIPTVKTKYLRIEVDFVSGEVKGRILDGPHQGFEINQLNPDQIGELLEFYRSNDDESLKLLSSYLGHYQKNYRAGSHQSTNTPASGDMSPSEARQILGVKLEADKEEIIAAHKKLIQKLHPDRGGSDYLAAKVNQAKAVLIGAKRQH